MATFMPSRILNIKSGIHKGVPWMKSPESTSLRVDEVIGPSVLISGDNISICFNGFGGTFA